MFSQIKNYFRHSDAKALVLMYHRVCDVATDPWQLAVSPHHFEDQIRMLTTDFKVLPVAELIPQLAARQIKDAGIYLTFDDGYKDNYLNAKPVLEKYSCPATFFISSFFTGKKQPFWWDKLEAILLHSHSLPATLELHIKGTLHAFDVDTEPLSSQTRQKQQTWKWPEPPPSSRCDLYLQLYKLLKPLTLIQIQDAIQFLEEWSGTSADIAPEAFAMSQKELQLLSGNNLFSLGLHTHTHISLGAHSKETQKQEIISNKDELNKNVLSQISAIAYPYGSYNKDTPAIIKKNKIDLGFTTNPGAITNNSSPLTLGRFQVTDCDAAMLKSEIDGWMGL